MTIHTKATASRPPGAGARQGRLMAAASRLAAATLVPLVLCVSVGLGPVMTASPAAAMNPPQTLPAGVVNALKTDMNDYWATVFRNAGRGYTGPSAIRYYNPGPLLMPCPENSYYCGLDRSIWLDARWNQAQMQARGDFATGAILAHEWAHHVQNRRGMNLGNYAVFQTELHADCMAGMYTRHAFNAGLINNVDYYEGRNEMYALGDTAYTAPDHHGTPGQRRAWFDYGWNHNTGLTACDSALRAPLHP